MTARSLAIGAALLATNVAARGQANPTARDGAAYHREVELEAAGTATSLPPEIGLPVEFGQGFLFRRHETVPAYTLSLGVVPTWRLGIVDLGVDLSTVYRNPDWDAVLGPRASVLLGAPYDVLALRLGVEGDHMPWSRSFRTGAVFSAGLGSLASVFRAVGGYDFDQKSVYVLLGIGVDLLAFKDPVAAILRYSKTEVPNP